MITIAEYVRMLEYEQDIIHMQTEGLSDSDLLVQLRMGNCMECARAYRGWIGNHPAGSGQPAAREFA